MIVVDNNEDPSLKKVASPPLTPQMQQGPSVPTPAAAASQSDPPPAYPGPPPPSQPQRTLPNPSHDERPPPPTQPLYLREEYGEPAGKRFIKAFFVAIFIYSLAGLLIDSFIEVSSSRRHRHSSVPGGWVGFPTPERDDFDRIKCTSGREWVSLAQEDIVAQGMRRTRMSFAFEEDVEDLFFRSMGSPSMGNVQVKELVGRGREVRVDVQVTFSQDGPIDQASICRLRTKQNSKAEGVGIFLPERRDGHTIAVDMTIYLPANSNSQRNFAALAIVMPMYTISLDNLARHFMFERVSLWTSNNAVEAKNLHAHNISVITSNHRISGVFKVTRALELQSKNGLIAVDVDALNAANGIPTTLNIETKNAPLTAKLSLTSTSTSHTGGIFQINAHTSNKPLSVTHAVSPPDSVLDLHASTTNAPALVQLDGAYEGGFAVRTTNAKPALAKNAASDPMGKGRRRVERVFQRAGVVQGAVAWVGEGEEWEDKDRKGEVAVESTNAPATLVL